MNMFKKNGGFTLVELIVVIAILAILAGVAIPAYSGYIKKAQDAAVVTELDAIATAAQAANATAGSITDVTVTANSITVTANKFADNYDEDFVMFYANAEDNAAATTGVFKTTIDLTGTSYEKGAKWYAAQQTADGKVTAEAGWNAVK